MRAFKLFATSGGQTIELPPSGTVLVGRAATSDVPIYDPTISRRHAELSRGPNGVQIHDLGSSNGTFLNGERVAETTAVDGDVVTFGKVAFHVREVTPAVARPAVDPGFVVPPPSATIVRPVPVADEALQAVAVARTSAATQLKVEGDSLEVRRARGLAVLLDISKELSRHQDVDKLLQKVVDITFQVMNVDRVSILMVEPVSGELIPRLSHNRLGDQAGGSRHVPRSIAQRAVDERLAILTDNAATDERFKGKSIMMQSVRSAMCAPLMGRDGRVLGLIYVDNLTATNSFGDEDLDFLIAFSGIAAVAIENGQLSERVRREAVVLSNFQRYFAPNLVQQIVSQEGEIQLGGTKRPVVIFFSDIRGFTSMSERMSPDEIAHVLTEYFTEMVEIVFKHGGTLDKFMGDAIMALWGAPIAHENDAGRAMDAAIEMQALLQTLNDKWEAAGRQRIEIGIGINFGEVFAGNIGSEQRLEYTVIGDAVNIAFRLCSKAGPGDILVSDSFRQALPDPPPLEPLETIELRGRAKAVQVYQVKR
ncbi:MAG: FHA domain-containing protein [Gemmatimonadota bacterium]|nr:FHA domain-containing protein [Gemmatimonadota bacterium]